jgi:5'-3' exonuclease
MTYIIVDTANTFFRARHVIRGDADIKLGMALHITFNSIKKAWQDFEGKHVVFCLEGRSWRKDFYTPYKANRAETRAAMTAKEAEEDAIFWETFDKFKDFIIEKTNCTVLHHPQLEADDLIAGFIQHHPNDNHVIISTDSDFHQLIDTNVKQYNGVSETLTTHEGIFDKKGKLVLNKKTKEPEQVNPEWILFEKCMRGDTSDNVFSAFPGVRTKGSKNKVGLTEAFQDRNSKGYAWNNLMLQRWVDHNGIEHRVIDDYERNKTLIDLKNQPDNIKKIIDETIISNTTQSKNISQVGIRLLKFCQLYDMQKIMDNIQMYAEPFQAKYATKILSQELSTQV